MSDEAKDYSRGYQAGRKRGFLDAEQKLQILKEKREERIYMRSLSLVLEHCSGWVISGKPINNAEGYCRLAKVFADNSITELNK